VVIFAQSSCLRFVSIVYRLLSAYSYDVARQKASRYTHSGSRQKFASHCVVFLNHRVYLRLPSWYQICKPYKLQTVCSAVIDHCKLLNASTSIQSEMSQRTAPSNMHPHNKSSNGSSILVSITNTTAYSSTMSNQQTKALRIPSEHISSNYNILSCPMACNDQSVIATF
jgi:hypothetical protein